MFSKCPPNSTAQRPWHQPWYPHLEHLKSSAAQPFDHSGGSGEHPKSHSCADTRLFLEQPAFLFISSSKVTLCFILLFQQNMAPAWYGGFLPTWWAWDYISSTGMKTLPLLVKQHPAVSKTFLLLLPLHHSFSLRISSSEMMNEAFPVQSQFLVAVCVVPGEKIGIVQRACSIKTTYKWQASTLNSRLWPFWQAIFVQLECTWEHLWALLTRKKATQGAL